MDRHFETVYIVNPEIGEEAIKGITAKAIELVGKNGGEDVDVDEWGRRRLAYPIAKRNDGHYVVLSYSRPGSHAGQLIDELELMFKHNENVMRFQTVVLKKRAEKPASAEAVAAAPETAEAAGQEGGADNA